MEIGLDLPEPPKLEIQDNTLLSRDDYVVAHPALRVPSVGRSIYWWNGCHLGATSEELHDLSFLMEEDSIDYEHKKFSFWGWLHFISSGRRTPYTD
jgi:hypothetical protein